MTKANNDIEAPLLASGGSTNGETSTQRCVNCLGETFGLKWLANSLLFWAFGLLAFGYFYGPCTERSCYDESGEIPCASCTLDYQLVCCPGSCSLLNNCTEVTGLAAQLAKFRTIGWTLMGIFIAVKLYMAWRTN
jgi:hypothetical protein